MHRTRYGHWETDAIVSKKGCRGGVQTSSERKSRLIMCKKRRTMSPRETVRVVRRVASQYAVLSLTYDNGIENRWHERTKIDSYFCDPYSSWQKGGVENANKMIRYFFPKGTDFSEVLQKELDRVVSIINCKPRKILRYQTALEVAGASGIIKPLGVLIEG
jgi:IS30 family transposase